jgi:hypothetical protein
MSRRLFVGSVVVALIAMLALAQAAAATPPTPISISVDTHFEPGAVDPFVATGGVVCSVGSVSTPFTRFVGFQSNTRAQILVVKHFVCPDGTFDLLLRVKLDFATGDTVGTWSVLGGTGAYTGLHGSGTLTGDGRATSVLDVYTGKMHID